MKGALLAFIFCASAILLALGNGVVLSNNSSFEIYAEGPFNFDTAVLSAPPGLRCPDCKPQLLPQPGAKLNYTQIMFDHVQVAGAEEYLVEVSLDKGGDSPFEHPFVKRKDSSTAVIIGNFDFGKKYIWRYAGLHNGKAIGWNGPYRFETLSNPFTDIGQFRVRVLQNDRLQNAGGLLVLDVAGSIIDRSGHVVWFLPWQPDAYVNESLQNIVNLKNLDMRVTPSGSITSIINHKAIDRDLQGNIIWQAPKRSPFYHDSLKQGAPCNYHHCFRKLQNGNYMVLDMEYLSLPDTVMYGSHLAPDGTMQKDTEQVIVPYDIIKEFDRNGNLVWNWRAKSYFDNFPWAGLTGAQSDPALAKPNRDGHINAFDVDEKNGVVYAGFRNLNRLIKIDKKSGAVVCSWGDNMTFNGRKNGDGFFLKQHGATIMHDGSVAVFNNNPNPKPVGNELPVSSVEIFSQPDGNTNSRIIWKYDCRLDTADNMASVSGSADELKNGNMLVCMGAVNRVFEVTRSKQVVWSALVESYYRADSAWHKFPLYRAHYTSSLYPCYFTIQTGRKTTTDGKVVFKLKIFNDGTEDDSYQVEVLTGAGNQSKQFTSPVLAGRKSIGFEIDGELVTSANPIAAVLVSSKTNPDFKRIAYLRK